MARGCGCCLVLLALLSVAGLVIGPRYWQSARFHQQTSATAGRGDASWLEGLRSKLPWRRAAEERRNQCFRDVRSLSTALQMYAFDHDKTLPSSPDWYATLAGLYLKPDADFRCPADRRDVRCSYALNARLRGSRLADIPDPHNTILIFEADWTPDQGWQYTNQMVARHNGKAVVAYADGRVAEIEPP